MDDNEEYEMSLGTSIRFDDDVGFIGEARKVRPSSGTEKQVQKAVQQANVRSKITQLQQKKPKIAGKVLAKAATANPMKFSASVTKQNVETAKAQAKTSANLEWTQQKRAAQEQKKQMMADLQKGIKAGAITKADANKIAAQKNKEIDDQLRINRAKIQEIAKNQVKTGAVSQINVFTQIVQKALSNYDLKIQQIESEQRKLQAQINEKKISPTAGKVMLDEMEKRKQNLILEKEKYAAKTNIDKIDFMKKQGLVNPATATRAKANLQAQMTKVKAQKGVNIQVMEIKAKLFTATKWIQAYEAAIAHAKQVGSTYIIIPVSRTKQGSTKEYKIPVRDAEVRLEKFRMMKTQMETQLQQLGDKTLPTTILAVDQAGSPITPEMLRSQVKFIQNQVAAKALDPVEGGKLIQQLQTIESQLYKGAGGPAQVQKVVVEISPEAKKTTAQAGEKVSLNQPGVPISQMSTPKPGVPPATPHTTIVTQEVRPAPVAIPTIETKEIEKGVNEVVTSLQQGWKNLLSQFEKK